MNFMFQKYEGRKSEAADQRFQQLLGELTDTYNTSNFEIPVENFQFELTESYEPFEDQNYEEIKEMCRRSFQKFTDPKFPPNDSSIFVSPRNKVSVIKWIRASDLSEDFPKFITEGATRFDINQGALGDCWFLAALGNLTMRPKLFKRVVPPNQRFEDSFGIFKFNFWHFGQWIEVVVDDYLPTFQGKLIFMKSDSQNEFWSPLLEKAYAKLNGCYQALSGGLTNEAMIDFTGGCAEHYDMSNKSKMKPDLYEIMIRASKRASMMGAGILADPFVYEAKLPNGLVRGHAYSITGITKVSIDKGGRNTVMPLVRIRNPWGNEIEWNGAWSDDSEYWNLVSKEERERLKLEKENDGEYFISKNDFLENFDMLEICNLSPDSLEEKDMNLGKLCWHEQMFHGEWKKGVSAGGCRNFIQTFPNNPQYKLILNDSDDDDNFCTCIISLMQKKGRLKKTQYFQGLEFIGFVLYRLENENQELPLTVHFFESHSIVASTPYFINFRDVTERLKLHPGAYVIIPSTFDPNVEAEFLLRVFSEKDAALKCCTISYTPIRFGNMF